MAKTETIVYDDEKIACFNLSNMVGFGGFNDKGDVMLVQAMFNFIVKGTGQLSKLGIKSKSDLPNVTGSFGGDTGLLIVSFQLKWMPILMQQHISLLFPGNYKDNIPAMGADERRQAIFLLHQFAQESAARLNETDYTVAMLNDFPELRRFIK